MATQHLPGQALSPDAQEAAYSDGNHQRRVSPKLHQPPPSMSPANCSLRWVVNSPTKWQGEGGSVSICRSTSLQMVHRVGNGSEQHRKS